MADDPLAESDTDDAEFQAMLRSFDDPVPLTEGEMAAIRAIAYKTENPDDR